MVLPVVVAEHGHRGVEAAVLERQLLRVRAHDRRGALGRWAIITSEGSTATTSRSRGS